MFFFFVISEREDREVGKTKRKDKRERKNNKIFYNESKDSSSGTKIKTLVSFIISYINN